MTDNVIECVQCEKEEEAFVPVYTYLRKADKSVASPEELADYWRDMNEDDELWTRIVDGLDPNYTVSITSSVEKVWVPPQFVGTPGDATEAGWSEESFGWICPECVGKKFEGLASGAFTLENFVNLIKGN